MRLFKFAFIFSLLFLFIFQEAEARRKILRGRKTITRWYMREMGIPAWAVVVIVGFLQLIIGGLMYVLLKVCVLDKPVAPRYRPAPVTPPTVEP